MIIGVDFDGTIVHNAYPEIGARNPYALKYLRLFVAHGAKLILYTMRDKEPLEQAVQFLESKGIELYGVNDNKQQKHWNTSRKVYCQLYIDDNAFGVPLINFEGYDKPVADWSIIGPVVLNDLKLRLIEQESRKLKRKK
jgi:hypothetical protein